MDKQKKKIKGKESSQNSESILHNKNDEKHEASQDDTTESVHNGQKDVKNEGAHGEDRISENKDKSNTLGIVFHELKEKPLTVSIVVLTFMGGILISLFKLVSYCCEKQVLESFHVSRKLLSFDLPETSIIILISFILSIIAFVLFCSLIIFQIRKKRFGPIQMIFWETSWFYYSLFLIMYFKLSDEIIGKIIFIIFAVFLLLMIIHNEKPAPRKKASKSKAEEHSTAQDGKETQSKPLEKKEIALSHEAFAVFTGILLLILAYILINKIAFKEPDYYLRQLENNAIVSEQKLYAIIYKTDDYIVGEAIEEKVDQNGETYYEIDTTRQQLFDSFDFEIKYLGDDASFALKPLNTPAQNPAATNTTVPATTIPDMTASNITTTDTTMNP